MTEKVYLRTEDGQPEIVTIRVALKEVNYAMAELLGRHPEINRSVEVAARMRNSLRVLPPTATAVSHHLLSRVATDQVPWFFERVSDGASLNTGHPILALRFRLLNGAQGHTRPPVHMRIAYIIRAWNAVREGRDLLKIQQGPKDDMPMPR